MKRKQLRDAGKIGSSPKDSVASLYDAGLRHFQSGQFAVAEERIQRALALDRSTPVLSISPASSMRRRTGSISQLIFWCARSASIRATLYIFLVSARY